MKSTIQTVTVKPTKLNYVPMLNAYSLAKDLEVFLDDEDKQRLIPHLSGYNKLLKFLNSSKRQMRDVEKLLVLELHHARRSVLVGKLLGRYLSQERQRLRNKISLCLKKN